MCVYQIVSRKEVRQKRLLQRLAADMFIFRSFDWLRGV